ncbi:MAG: Fic family protein [Alteromonadaceae bacterium]|uniref:Fic/DOC family protein n=1 Tax=Marinobacter sp. TaxID=50741 RepID=UPI0029C5D04F|nr:Fic family protein [Marinobacter sp.]MDX5385796.1 Fic family protein [Marinobacter sp.]MDX5440041.1 Fic family protein [Alteromonadaceae bacterium]
MDGYEHYDLQDEDPYLIEGSTCLKNLLGITNTAELNEAEAAISAAAMAELIARPVAPTFGLKHLCEIHFRLFGDVYDWAGHLRSTEISKGGMLFLPYGVIPQVAGELFSELHAEDLLRGLPKEEFAFRAAYYLGRINMVHPFREGNGRTQRIFLDQLAELSDYAFEWSAVSGEQMAIACRSARQKLPDYSRLERLLALNIVHLA